MHILKESNTLIEQLLEEIYEVPPPSTKNKNLHQGATVCLGEFLKYIFVM